MDDWKYLLSWRFWVLVVIGAVVLVVFERLVVAKLPETWQWVAVGILVAGTICLYYFKPQQDMNRWVSALQGLIGMVVFFGVFYMVETLFEEEADLVHWALFAPYMLIMLWLMQWGRERQNRKLNTEDSETAEHFD